MNGVGDFKQDLSPKHFDMKKFLYLPAVIIFSLFLPLIAPAQLTNQQKSAINLYIENTPSLSKYDKGIREKVVADPTISTEVQACWAHLRKYAALRNSRNMEDLRTMYSELGVGAPDVRDKLLPDFKKLDYLDMLDQKPGNDITISVSSHLTLLNHYAVGRRERLTPKNAFGSMIFIRPELVQNLRKAASADMGKPADDASLILWLEINYWNKMRQDAVKKIMEEEKNVARLVASCLSSLPGKLEEAGDKEQNTEQDWNGVFFSPSLTLKFERRNQFVFGTGDVRAGGAVESVQWNLSIINGGQAEGDWTVTFMNDDFIINRIGTVKVKLDGDIMHFDMIGTDWNIKWKEGVKQYPIVESSKSIVGIRADGDFKRKE